jgi:predicted RNA-binding protein Jag
LDAAKEVKRWGEPSTLPPMSGRDRRIVHLALEGDAEIVTESVVAENGNDRFKSIIISLKK